MEKQVDQILFELKNISDQQVKLDKEKRFGIASPYSLGIYQRDINQIAKGLGKNTRLGFALFDTGIYEARLLCACICKPDELTEEVLDQWVREFNTWEICDSFCMKLFKYHKKALKKAYEWVEEHKEFQKRAGFVLMATYGFAHKEADNSVFQDFLNCLESHTKDNRLYVKKSVNWALRQIGKRNQDLRGLAIETANRIKSQPWSSAQWIGQHALNELTNPNCKVLDYPRAVYRM